MIYQHKNSIPEIKDLSEQRYLMRVQQRLQDNQQQSQQASFPSYQETYGLNQNNYMNSLQNQQQYAGQIQKCQNEQIDNFASDPNSSSPHLHRTNQQRSKTISLINYKEVRNNSLENNQRGVTPPNSQQYLQPHQEVIQREIISKGQQIQHNMPLNSNGQNSGIYAGNISSQFSNQSNLMQQKYQHQQQALLNKPELYTNFQQQQQSTFNYNKNGISNNSLTIQPCDISPSYHRINHHSLSNNEFINGTRSNSQQGQIDSFQPLRSNSNQNQLDHNVSRSNSQQGHNNSVNTSVGQRTNHFQSYHQSSIVGQPQTNFNQTQASNNYTTNNNNSIETLIDLENKWSDIKKVHQNFQQRSLSNSSSSNSIAANHRPNSSLNISTNNNLSFINASGALLDQGTNSKNINTNYSQNITPLDSKIDKQQNNNNKLIKKVVPLSKINLNSIIQTGTNNLSAGNLSGQNGINGQKPSKMRLNLQGFFQDQVQHPFESQSLPGSTRGHHDSFQCTGYVGTNQSNNSYSNQFYEFDSKPTENIQNKQKNYEIIQNPINNHQYPSQQKYHHSNNLSLDNTLFSHQNSLINMQSMNDIYSGQQLQQQHPQLQISHSKCLSYQHIKPQQSNIMNIQNDYNAYDSNISLQNKMNNQIFQNNQLQNNNINYNQILNTLQPTQQHHSRGDSTSKYFVPTSHSIPNQPNYISHHNQQMKQQLSNQNSINQISIQSEIQDNNQFQQKSQSSSITQLSNLSTANFKSSNFKNQEFLDYPSNQQLESQYSKNQFTLNQHSSNQTGLHGKQSQIQLKKENNDQSKINQEQYQSPANQKGSMTINEANRQYIHISPNNLNKQQSQNASSKERQSSNQKNKSDTQLSKKQSDENVNINEQNKKKKYSEQQFEYIKQIIPSYQQQQAKKNLFSQALAQQKGSFDLNSHINSANGSNQLDYTPTYENSSLNEIDNHLYMKYNEYKIRQQQQTEGMNTLNTENPKAMPSTTINTQQSGSGINNQQQIQLSSNKRTSIINNNNNCNNTQLYKDQNSIQILKNQYYQTASIQDIVKDQRKSSLECNSKANQQKIIDQENKNPNNTNNYFQNNQAKLVDQQILLKAKQCLKQSNSQGQNEFQQMQQQIKQQQQQQLYQQFQGYQASQQQVQDSQQKTFSPRVNYKIISENIKKQKFGISQKNEKIIQNNQLEYTNKNSGLVYKENTPSQQNTIQIQQFFPEQGIVQVSKSFIESKKGQNLQIQEKSVNEMYENKSINSNNLNIINKKNGKIIELPLKQVVSKKILPKYQVNNTDSSEDYGIQQTNISAINLKHTTYIAQSFHKPLNEEINQKKPSITQADTAYVQVNNPKINQTNQINSSQKLNSQVASQKTESEKPHLKRQNSSSTNNGVFDPFKNISNEQQGAKTQQMNSKSSNQNDQQLQQKQVNINTTQTKIQCMPCNKNLIEAKQQQRKEEIMQQQQKQKTEQKTDKKDIQQGITQINYHGSNNQQYKQPSAPQGKSTSSFIMPNLVFS